MTLYLIIDVDVAFVVAASVVVVASVVVLQKKKFLVALFK